MFKMLEARIPSVVPTSISRASAMSYPSSTSNPNSIRSSCSWHSLLSYVLHALTDAAPARWTPQWLPSTGVGRSPGDLLNALLISIWLRCPLARDVVDNDNCSWATSAIADCGSTLPAQGGLIYMAAGLPLIVAAQSRRL